jgi:hypothetical protein
MSRVGTTSTPAKPTPTVQPMQTAKPATPTMKPSTDRVAKLAYEKWLKRGCVHGFDLQDWVEAEKELMAEHGGTKPSSTTTSAPTGMRR